MVQTDDKNPRSFAELEPQENAYEQWVDRILFSPEFGTYWGMKWGDIFRCDEKVLDDRGVKSFSGWIKQSIHEGKPVDQFVREMITARGSTYENPPANFFRAVRDSNTRGEAVARVFLGYRMQCAQCHNHPFDRWTQNDYYRWASLFSRLDYDVKANQRKDDLDKNEFRGEQFVVLRDKGEVKHPRTGAVMEPSFLSSESIQESISPEDPLLSLSQWLTSRSNKQFARAQVNWVWYQLLGRGLVDPVDDFRLTNPATHPALLDALADQWIEHDFDLRWLVRKIVMSHVFRQASQPQESEHNVAYYSHYLVRRLPAEVLLDAQSQVLGIGLKFDEQPEGTRAIELPGGQREQRYARSDGDKLLFAFGKPARAIACECERSNDLSLSQVFLLMQSESVSKRLNSQQGRANQMARSALSDEEKLAELYWLALSRPPSEDERQYALSLRQQGLSEEQWCQDLLWALLNSQEFVLAH